MRVRCLGCGVCFTGKNEKERQYVINQYAEAVLDNLQEQCQDWRRINGKLPRDEKLAIVKRLILHPPCGSTEQQFRCPVCYKPNYDNDSAHLNEPTRAVMTVTYHPADEELEEDEECISIVLRPLGNFECPSVYLFKRLERLAQLYRHTTDYDVQEHLETICAALDTCLTPGPRHWNQGWSCNFFRSNAPLPLEHCNRLRDRLAKLFKFDELDYLEPAEYKEFGSSQTDDDGDEVDEDPMTVAPPPPSASTFSGPLSGPDFELLERWMKDQKTGDLYHHALKLSKKIKKKTHSLSIDNAQQKMLMAELERRHRRRRPINIFSCHSIICVSVDERKKTTWSPI